MTRDVIGNDVIGNDVIGNDVIGNDVSPNDLSPNGVPPTPVVMPSSVFTRARPSASWRRVPYLDRIPPSARPWAFAVEDDAAQITWRALGPGPVRFRLADTTVEVVTDGGPGAVVLEGLPPSTRLELVIDGEGAVVTDAVGSPPRRLPRSWRRQWLSTLAPPPGEELFRFATISDMHIGTIEFGFRATMVERPVPDMAHPERATRAAIDDLTAWGAQLLLLKGDITNNGRAKDWDTIGHILRDISMPVEMLPGNHDHYGRRGDPDPYVALELLGHELTRHVKHIDVPGLRVVLVDSTKPGKRMGRVAYIADPVLDLLRGASTPAFVTLHHYAQRLPVPTFFPPGIPSHEANAFLNKVARVQPATMVSSGHTHRHRRRHVGPVVLTEVGSPKDYPGTWAGYVVHEGGIRQVVRRVSRPDILRWTDFTSAAAWHAWGAWSPGLLSHRCFTHPWPHLQHER